MAEVVVGQAPPEAMGVAEPTPEPETVADETVEEPPETLPAVQDQKRKHDELEADEEAPEETGNTTEAASVEAPAAVSAEGEGGAHGEVSEAEEPTVETAGGVAAVDAKRQRLGGDAAGSDEAQVAASETPIGNDQVPTAENIVPTDKPQETVVTVSQQCTAIPSGGQHSMLDGPAVSRKIELPNNKVGVLIGKAGETIRFLQFTSGAKIQITRDGDADPYSSTRPVELIGRIEDINKAEKLIKDIIAKADAGGSPSLVARGLGSSQHGAEQLQIQVPNEKVGLIIGKGGETIKSLQTRSGARIQLIPTQHLPEGNIPKERTVRITGNKEHIEAATEMIKVVMSQVPVRSSTPGGYTQQMYRPQGPTPQWGLRAVPPGQSITGYAYQQRGEYPSRAKLYPPPAYGSYGHQCPPRGSIGTGWDRRAVYPAQTSSQFGGYDYNGHGGHPSDMQTSAAGPVTPVSGALTAPMNYYGLSQMSGYGQSAYYPQSAPSQSCGHGYDEATYDSQASTQQVYGQQPATSQPGVYPRPNLAPQSGYAQQQPYNKPSYGGVPLQGMPQSYGPPRPT